MAARVRCQAGGQFRARRPGKFMNRVVAGDMRVDQAGYWVNVALTKPFENPEGRVTLAVAVDAASVPTNAVL